MKVFSSKLRPVRNQHFWAGKYTLTKLLSPNGVPLLDQVLLATISSLNHAERHNTLLDWKNAQRVFHSQHSNGSSLCYDVRHKKMWKCEKQFFDRELQGHQAPEWCRTLCFCKTNFKCEIAAAKRRRRNLCECCKCDIFAICKGTPKNNSMARQLDLLPFLFTTLQNERPTVQLSP